MAHDIPKTGNFVKRHWSQHGERRHTRSMVNVPVMGNNLKGLREGRGWTLETAAAELGMSRGGYIKLERGERRLSLDRIAKVAAIYKIAEASVLSSGGTVAIVGYISAGGRVEMYPDGADLHQSPRPSDATPTTVALQVRGAALPGVADDQWLVFYDEVASDIPQEWLGKLCVLSLNSDAEKRVGRAYNGRHQGRYDVVVQGFEPLRDVTVTWSAKVNWIRPE